MKNMLILTVAFFLTVFIVSISPAGNVYEWVDDNGVYNVSDVPPPAKVKKFSKGTFHNDTQEEIQRFQQKQEQYNKTLEATRRANQAVEERKRQREQRVQKEEEKKDIYCYTQQSPGVVTGGVVTGGVVTGGVVIPGPTYYICKDKNGKIISKTKL